jgi:membrane associated rhomboid family serine protease
MPPLTPIVRSLVIINVAVFALMYFIGGQIYDPNSWYSYLALHHPKSEFFAPIQLVSHVFMHGGLTHLFFNMFGLWMFGPILEARFGQQKFLILYALAAVGAFALHLGYASFEISQFEAMLEAFRSNPSLQNFNAFFEQVPVDALRLDSGESLSAIVERLQGDLAMNKNVEFTVAQGASAMQEYINYLPDIPVVGASGAIYGIVAAFAIFYPDFKLALIFLPIPFKAKYFVPVLLVIELVLGIIQPAWDPLAHFAHLGGAIVGGLLAFYWKRTSLPPGVRRWDDGVPNA